MDEFTVRFKENLNSLMYNAKMRPNELAEKVGIQVTTLRKYLRGESTPSIGILVNLADALDVSTDDLLGRRSTYENYRKYKLANDFVFDMLDYLKKLGFKQ